MPPSAQSMTTTGSSSTGLSSNISDNPRSLKNYDLIDKDQLTAVVDVLSSINFENCDICLVTTPNGFPPEKLSEILNHGNETHDVKVGGDFYTVRDTSNISTNIAVPIPKSESRYKCRTIPKSVTLTKSMKNSTSSELHFIPRPEFPKMSQNLIERFVPFGCQVVGSNIVQSPSKKKHKKRKRKLQNEDETFNQTLPESPSKKKRKRKKSDISPSNGSTAHEEATNTEHMLERAEKEAKKARKEAKKAKKKRKKE